MNNILARALNYLFNFVGINITSNTMVDRFHDFDHVWHYKTRKEYHISLEFKEKSKKTLSPVERAIKAFKEPKLVSADKNKLASFIKKPNFSDYRDIFLAKTNKGS